MKKQFGAIFLLAGTAIGSGMLSLPLVLAKFGISFCVVIMLFFAGVTYITALIRCDLNLNFNAGATLREVGEKFSGKIAGALGDISIKLLLFSLMAAYISGIASIVDSFLGNAFNKEITFIVISILIAIVFLNVSEIVISINKYLFVIMISIFITLITFLLFQTPIESLPLGNDFNCSIVDWAVLIPIVFTSFGFQGGLHSMTQFVRNNKAHIRKACLWGSIIPACVYIVWTFVILVVVSNTNAEFYEVMLRGEVRDIGELIDVLCNATSSRVILLIIWLISIFAILTSILGVGLSLIDTLKNEMKVFVKWKAVAIVVFCPAIVAMLIPNAFIKILNVSGIILAVIAIVLPVFLSAKMQRQFGAKCETFVKNKLVMFSVLICGIGIIALGILSAYLS